MGTLPAIDVESDPRVTGDYIRQVSGDAGTVTLVRVVHDHPASTYRVREVIDELDPLTERLDSGTDPAGPDGVRDLWPL